MELSTVNKQCITLHSKNINEIEKTCAAQVFHLSVTIYIFSSASKDLYYQH